MNTKLFVTAIVILFIGLALAPSINANDKEINDDKIEPLDIGRTIIRGFGFFPQSSEDSITFFVIRFRYISIDEPEMETYWFKWITLQKGGFNNFCYFGKFQQVLHYSATVRGNPIEP